MWYNPIIEMLLKSPFHGFVSKTMMLIAFTGRKSGHVYTIPVNYFQMEDDHVAYIGSVSSKERTWWRNLRGGTVTTVYIKGKSYQATSEVFEDNETVCDYLSCMFTTHKNIAKYYEICIDAEGKPDISQIRRLAEKSAFVRTMVNEDLTNIGQ